MSRSIAVSLCMKHRENDQLELVAVDDLKGYENGWKMGQWMKTLEAWYPKWMSRTCRDCDKCYEMASWAGEASPQTGLQIDSD